MIKKQVKIIDKKVAIKIGQIVKFIDPYTQPNNGIWMATITAIQPDSYQLQCLHPFDDQTLTLPKRYVYALNDIIPSTASKWVATIPNNLIPQTATKKTDNCGLLRFYQSAGFDIADNEQLKKFCPVRSANASNTGVISRSKSVHLSALAIKVIDQRIWSRIHTMATMTGVANMGNTCYFNAGIMSLFYNPTIRQHVWTHNNSAVDNTLGDIFKTYYTSIMRNRPYCTIRRNLIHDLQRQLKLKPYAQDDAETVIQRILGHPSNKDIQQLFAINRTTTSSTIYNAKIVKRDTQNDTIYNVIITRDIQGQRLQDKIMNTLQTVDLFAKGKQLATFATGQQAMNYAQHLLQQNRINPQLVKKIGLIQTIPKTHPNVKKGHRFAVYPKILHKKSNITHLPVFLHVTYGRLGEGERVELPNLINLFGFNYALYAVTIKHAGAQFGHWSVMIKPWMYANVPTKYPGQVIGNKRMYKKWAHIDDETVTMYTNINTAEWQRKATSLFFVRTGESQ